MTKSLISMVVATTDIDVVLRQDMFAIYARYYVPALVSVFEADLNAKSHVILLRDGNGILRGFSTLRSWCIESGMGSLRLIFSGDTIIEKAFWGEQTLPLAWLEHAGTIKASDPITPLFWFLIAKGHRTYRLLNAFALDYFPMPNRETPKVTCDVMTALGVATFGERYDASSGIVRHPPDGVALSAKFVGSKRMNNPHAAFFTQCNPGYADGDELLCLCELSPENLRPAARKSFLIGYERQRVEKTA